MGFNVAVSRPVGKREMMTDPGARASMQKDWKGQRDAGVYDFSNVREYDDMVKEPKRMKKEIHMARVHAQR